MSLTTAWFNARTYPDPRGRGPRHNDVAMARFVGLDPRIFRPLQKTGFHQWQGADCKPRRLPPLPPENRIPEETYLESDGVALREALQLTPEQRYERMGVLNRQMLGQKLGINTFGPHGQKRLDKWAQEGKLTPQKTPSPDNGKPTTVYPIAEANALATELQAVRDRDTIRKDGKDYLHLEKACEILQVTRGTIYLWGEYGIVPLGGEALDRIREPAPGNWSVWIAAEQVERIRVAMQMRHAPRVNGELCPVRDFRVINGECFLSQTAVAEGRGLTGPIGPEVLSRLVRDKIVRTAKARKCTRGGIRHPNFYHRGELQDYLSKRQIAFDGAFSTEEGPAFSIARAVGELRDRCLFTCSRWFLQEQIRKSKYLPGGKLPAVLRKPASLHGSWRGREITAVLGRDLANMVATIKGLVEAGNNLDPDWADARDIGRTLGYNRNKAAHLCMLLKKWRESGELTNVRRVYWDKRGQRKQVYVYHVPDVVRLAGDVEREIEDLPEVMPSAESRGSRREGEPLPQEPHEVNLGESTLRFFEEKFSSLEEVIRGTAHQTAREYTREMVHTLKDLSPANGQPLSDPTANGRASIDAVSITFLAVRLRIDVASGTATLDGNSYSGVDQVALRALNALRDAQLSGQTPISKRKLRERYLPGCNHDTTLSRWLGALPEELLALVIGTEGRGMELILPAQ